MPYHLAMGQYKAFLYFATHKRSSGRKLLTNLCKMPRFHRGNHLVLALAQRVTSSHCAGGPVLVYLHQTNQSPEPLVDISLRVGTFILKPALVHNNITAFIVIAKALWRDAHKERSLEYPQDLSVTTM